MITPTNEVHPTSKTPLMNPNYVSTIESLAALLLYVVALRVTHRIVDRTLADRLIQETRGMVIKKFLDVVVTFILLAVLVLIWGVDQADLALFIGSVLTVLGIAFFAQWSILSNITSSIILFFNHPVKLNDEICILEGKDYVLEGRVIDVGLFFVTLENAAEEKITLPNNIFMLKSIKSQSKTPPAVLTSTAEVSPTGGGLPALDKDMVNPVINLDDIAR